MPYYMFRSGEYSDQSVDGIFIGPEGAALDTLVSEYRRECHWHITENRWGVRKALCRQGNDEVSPADFCRWLAAQSGWVRVEVEDVYCDEAGYWCPSDCDDLPIIDDREVK